MNRQSQDDQDVSPRDWAARAAWLSYVGGLTQGEIAQELGISRQRAQRLVARAAAEGLIRVTIDHPIAACLEMERELKARYGLDRAWVSPSLGSGSDPITGLSVFAAPVFEGMFNSEAPQVIALATGRTLRAIVEQMQHVDGSHHKLVALNGNVAPDGSATAYEVIVRLAEKTSAPQYPLAIPVVARTREEYALYTQLPHVQATRKLAEAADLAIVGIGQMGDDAPLCVDGFITRDELADLQSVGAAGEIAGHVFDHDGQFMDHPVKDRIMGVRVPVEGMPVCCVGAGENKKSALKAALRGGLIDQIITDEATANSVLEA